MKKYFALMLVVFTLALVGTAMAGDSDVGHVIYDPGTGQGGTGQATITIKTRSHEVKDVVVIDVDQLKNITSDQITQSTTESLMDSLNNASLELGMSDAEVEDWRGKVNEIATQIANAVLQLKDIVSLFEGANPAENDQLTVTQHSESSFEDQIAEASAKLQESRQTAITILHSLKSEVSGIFTLSLPTFLKETWGLDISFYANRQGSSDGGSDVLAAATDGAAVFLNSKGEQVTKIPDGSNGEMPGFVTVAVYMEAGATYEPVIATPIAAVQAKTDLRTETKASVEVREEVLVASTATFSTYVNSSLLAGTNYTTIPVGAVSTTGWTDSSAETAYKTANSSFDVFTVAALPAIAAPSESTWYIAAVSFDRGSKTVADLFTGAELEFFPNNVLSEPDTDAVFLQESDGVLVPLDVEDVFGASSRYTRGYVAFQLSAAASKPAIATFVTKAGGGDTPSGPDTPTPVTPVNPGSSGGGCDAGFGALALAVLGALMVTRRK